MQVRRLGPDDEILVDRGVGMEHFAPRQEYRRHPAIRVEVWAEFPHRAPPIRRRRQFVQRNTVSAVFAIFIIIPDQAQHDLYYKNHLFFHFTYNSPIEAYVYREENPPSGQAKLPPHVLQPVSLIFHPQRSHLHAPRLPSSSGHPTLRASLREEHCQTRHSPAGIPYHAGATD